MIVSEVSVRLCLKIPGPMQYSNIEAEVSMSARLEEGDTPQEVSRQLLELCRKGSAAELQQSRAVEMAVVRTPAGAPGPVHRGGRTYDDE